MKPGRSKVFAPGFVCSCCGKTYHAGESEYTCPICGNAGILEAALSQKLRTGNAFTKSPGIWRYERFLSISKHAPRPPLPVGATPLLPGGRLAAYMEFTNLWIKNDSLNPTGSLKDRASAVALARCAEIGARCVAVASTGNAGSSLAGLAASMGIPAVIFVPAGAPRAKITQALMYGATVFAVEGSYDDAFDLCLKACQQFGWYNRNTALNPYTIEGKKTVSYEIYEQLGKRAPDLIFIPTGDGCILSGVARGFRDLQELGMVSRVPRLIAVQAARSNWVARALAGEGEEPIVARSVADSIVVNLPRNGPMAVRDIKRTGGTAVVVTDDEILAAERQLASLTGIFAEPAAAASLAGLHVFLRRESVPHDATVVLLVTGSGLKDIDAAADAVPGPVRIRPRLEELERALGNRCLPRSQEKW
ncbi:MAG: threonine synthase [Chloroflexota bacterium]